LKLFGLTACFLNVLTSFSPHFSWGDHFISTKFITLATYLSNWAFIALIIVAKFLSNHHLVLLEVINVNNSTPSPLNIFEVSVGCHDMHSSFHEVYWKGIKLIFEKHLNILQNHFFSTIIFDMVFDLHHARPKFCIGSKVGVWFFAHPVIPPFHLAYNVFSFVLHTKLGLPHSLALRVIHWICG